ncbi:MAG: 5-(carboxyamino)imidazole ribonucleotide synthase, partial [Armatimonadetes bacterium]|nr:5-(carboxyamino)imidazole ribonucleotide synthase [Armatimonadota bacterium]
MTVGVLGGGQLGRMLALAGLPLGLRFRFLDPSADAPAGQIAPRVAEAYEDPKALESFVEGLDLVTYEFENVPVSTARYLEQRVPVYPPPAALETAQDRLIEKSLFRECGIPVPPFAPVVTLPELQEAVAEIGLPAVLKTRRFGYDGKGQRVLRDPGDVESAWASLGGVPLILEGFVPFTRELSVLAVRSPDGETAFYPLVENHHRDGILRLSLAPAPGLTPELQDQAERHAHAVMDALDYVGVLAIEFFEHEGRLVANEMAPRVHNSGHWSIEGAETSQFDNHLRAVLGWPLGSTALVGASDMVNLIGAITEPSEILKLPHAHLHHNGNRPRPGRKVGNVTLRAATESDMREP